MLCVPPAEPVPLGGLEEDQRLLLGLGGHVPLHQQQPALAPRGAQRLGLLRLPGAGASGRAQSQPVHGHHRRPHL